MLTSPSACRKSCGLSWADRTSSVVRRDPTGKMTRSRSTATVKSPDRRMSRGRNGDRPARVDPARRARGPRTRADLVGSARRLRWEWTGGRERAIPGVRDRAILVRPRGERPPDPDGSPRDRGPWASSGGSPGVPERLRWNGFTGSRYHGFPWLCVVRLLRRCQRGHAGADHRTDGPRWRRPRNRRIHGSRRATPAATDLRTGGDRVPWGPRWPRGIPLLDGARSARDLRSLIPALYTTQEGRGPRPLRSRTSVRRHQDRAGNALHRDPRQPRPLERHALVPPEDARGRGFHPLRAGRHVQAVLRRGRAIGPRRRGHPTEHAPKIAG